MFEAVVLVIAVGLAAGIGILVYALACAAGRDAPGPPRRPAGRYF